jgi:peptidoglycan/LPS O-acetylase OafA/YrhL
MKYRADIDGLRALAVLPVVLYHAGVPGVPGGFLGVDVFFVISGYLICGMIDKEIREGTFSPAGFCKRRILRIFPALVAMLLATSLAAYLYFLPVELKQFSASLVSAIASVSNIYFAATAGYFDAPTATKPLLHTWSLSVEEQFYVCAPLFMFLAYRFFPHRVKVIFASVTAISLACELLVYCRNSDFAFYLTPCRAWELSLGALLSIGFLPAPATALHKNAVGWLGLLLILAAVFFGSSAPLPIMQISAAAGAAIIIASSRNGLSVPGRLLSARPAVFVGLISYSLYLWHWPIIVFQRSDSFLLADASGAAAKAGLVAISLAVAYLSWKFIETPFRTATPQVPKYAVFAGAGASMASLAVLAWLWTTLNGLPDRFADRVVSIDAYLAYDPSAAFRGGRCYIWSNRQTFDTEDCLRLDPERPNYLLMGDSHSAHLWPGLSGALPDVNIMQASASMCRPVIPGPALFDMNFCPRMMRFVFNSFLIAHKVDRVLLAATWKDEDMQRLAHTLEVLTARGMEVVVLGPSSNTTGRFRACSPTKSAIVPPRSPAICAPPESPIATADLPNS